MDPITLGAGFGLTAIVLGLLFGWICRKVAGRKSRSKFWWGIWGFFFTWVALIVLALLDSKAPETTYRY
ncbi:hypothetical protein GCM10022261_28430 [Brevibacterium daeguense]|uniref:DUF4190 domain-containing protein n=1 Tax=Brevibacterium daeguense TaxID=909936 RepID=A0ABP8EMW0_9MICO|nr:hypothetical protein [Brevibacterium daeguense]